MRPPRRHRRRCVLPPIAPGAASGRTTRPTPSRSRRTRSSSARRPRSCRTGASCTPRTSRGEDEHQVYIANLDGSGEICITCGGEPGPGMPMPPNGVPVPRPQGDWVLFHSWDERNITVGGPGFGGLGSALYVVRPDGVGRHAAHRARRRARRRRGRGRLPRVLVTRRQAARLGAPQLELRDERRRRQVGCPRRRLRGRRRQPAAPRERPRRPPRERPLLRDAVVGARRQRLPLHGVVGHRAQPRALLLQARGRRHALRGHPPDRQRGLGRAGDLHARHEERALHVHARPPGLLQHLRASCPTPRA